MEEGEKRLKQEDCNEDSLGSGILTLTTRRLAFDKTRSRMMDFSKLETEITPYDIKKLIDELLFSLKALARFKKIMFSIKIDSLEL